MAPPAPLYQVLREEDLDHIYVDDRLIDEVLRQIVRGFGVRS